jgi:hypothetical protein
MKPPSSHPVVLKVLLALIPESQLDKNGKHRTTPKPQKINKKTKIRKGLKKDGEGGGKYIYSRLKSPKGNLTTIFNLSFFFVSFSSSSSFLP